MIEALWSVEFITNVGGFGGGIVIFETGRIFGGDSVYFYTGSYELEDLSGSISATVKVTHYFGNPFSAFGPYKEFTLEISGKPEMPSFYAEGKMREDPLLRIQLLFTHRSDLPNP